MRDPLRVGILQKVRYQHIINPKLPELPKSTVDDIICELRKDQLIRVPDRTQARALTGYRISSKTNHFYLTKDGRYLIESLPQKKNMLLIVAILNGPNRK